MSYYSPSQSHEKPWPNPGQDGKPQATAEHHVGGEGCQLVLVKQGQRYVFRYTPGEEAALLDSLAAMARDPHNDLTWFDAAVLSHQLGCRLSQNLPVSPSNQPEAA